MQPPGRAWLAGLALVAIAASCSTGPNSRDEAADGVASPAPSRSPTPSRSPSETPVEPTIPSGSGLAGYYRQQPDWRGCGGPFECTTVVVPLDYAHPGKDTIELSVIRRPAGRPGARVGSLLVNPGGPGGSGVDYARRASESLGKPLFERFDVVGWDPRGVNESTAVDCLDDGALDRFIAADPAPDGPAEIRQVTGLVNQLVRGCRVRSGELLPHLATAYAARDMDVLRAVLGDRRMHYLGKSYGTFLGATYAELFPEKVGRLVLDGAIDPSLTSRQRGLSQARGFEVALRAFVADCLNHSDCPLGPTVSAGIRQVDQLLAELDREPIPGDGTRSVTEGYGLLGVLLPLYDERLWPFLRFALSQAFDGNGAPLLQIADLYTSRGPGGFYDNSVEAIYAVNCLDYPDVDTLAEVRAQLPRFRRASPHFGDYLAWGSIVCARWPVPPVRRPHPVHAPAADPIVVVGTTRDPATPYQGAVSLARQLNSGVLLSLDDDGHTAYFTGSECIDSAVERYLIRGDPPPDGKRC